MVLRELVDLTHQIAVISPESVTQHYRAPCYVASA